MSSPTHKNKVQHELHWTMSLLQRKSPVIGKLSYPAREPINMEPRSSKHLFSSSALVWRSVKLPLPWKLHNSHRNHENRTKPKWNYIGRSMSLLCKNWRLNHQPVDGLQHRVVLGGQVNPSGRKYLYLHLYVYTISIAISLSPYLCLCIYVYVITLSPQILGPHTTGVGPPRVVDPPRLRLEMRQCPAPRVLEVGRDGRDEDPNRL